MQHCSSDESIPEDSAFNSADEALYGKFFQSSSSSKNNSIQSNTRNTGSSTSFTSFLATEVNLPQKPYCESDTVTLEVKEGTKAVLSMACLDSSEMGTVRLLFRVVNDDDDNGTSMPWMCLCHFHANREDGVSSSSSCASLNNVEVAGPCTVEWKTTVTYRDEGSSGSSGSLNLFGRIVPTKEVSGGSLYVTAKDKDGSSRGGATLKETFGCVEPGFRSKRPEEMDRHAIETNSISSKKSNKRKLSHDHDEQEKQAAASKSDDETSSASRNENKLSKKQRKQLAQEKAKQLQETLNAARRDADTETTKSKKKKKQSTTSNTTSAKPTSLTRERRLSGGILISDILLGTGKAVSSGKKISLHYTGILKSDGRTFDKNHSKSNPLQFRQGTGEVIRGLERGLEGMKAGGERVITVPAALGYGEKGMGAEIPPDSDLLFEVKLLKVG